MGVVSSGLQRMCDFRASSLRSTSLREELTELTGQSGLIRLALSSKPLLSENIPIPNSKALFPQEKWCFPSPAISVAKDSNGKAMKEASGEDLPGFSPYLLAVHFCHLSGPPKERN